MAIQFDIEPEQQSAPTKGKGLSTEVPLPWQNRAPKSDDRMFFTEQLAMLLETGENLYGALTTIVKQTENPKMRETIEKLAQDVSDGLSFAGALEKHPDIFSSTYVNLVRASETGGFMHEVLQQLLDMDKKREELRNTLVSAATYPVFLVAFSIAVVVFVLVIVFPKFGTMFTSIYDQLPGTTKALMAMSDTLREQWWLVLGGMAVLAVGFRQWISSESGRARVDHWQLHVPVLKDIYVQIYLVQSLQVMSLSLTNGVSVMESLDACRDVVRNKLYRGLIAKIEDSVQAGAGVATAFAEATFIPELAKHMIATGEQTGNLGSVMGRIAQYYEVQLNKKLNAASKLAEPIMLLVMGVVVGVLVSSLILPIFKLSRAVS